MIRRNNDQCTSDQKKECEKANGPWLDQACKECEKNKNQKSIWVDHLSWIYAIISVSNIDMNDLPLNTWQDLGIYKLVTQPRL